MMFTDVEKWSDHIAIKDDKGNRISYGQLCESAFSMEEYRGNRLLTLVYCDNSFENLVMVFKLFFLGQPMLLLSEKSDIIFRNDILERFHPFYIWEKGELKKANVGNSGYYEIHPDLVLLLSTSGSVGTPKLARISYHNITEELRIGVREFRIREGQKGMRILPIEHVSGLAFCLYHWSVGGCMVTTDAHVMSSRFDQLYDEEGIQNMIGIPFHYRILLKKGFWQDKERISRLNCAMYIGAKLDEDEQYAMVSVLQEKFLITYGQTECMSAVTTAAFHNPEAKPGTVGRPLPGVKASVDKKRELYIESPTVCMGYALDYRDIGKGDENHGIIATGDLAYMDEDGYIFLKGRIRRFVKILGNRIGLDEIEALLRMSFPGLEFACTGENDELNVFFRKTEEYNLEDLCKKVLFKKADIPLSMIHCYLVEDFPRSGAGKILYSELEAVRK